MNNGSRIFCLQVKRVGKFMTNRTLLKYLYCVLDNFCALLFMYISELCIYITQKCLLVTVVHHLLEVLKISHTCLGVNKSWDF